MGRSSSNGDWPVSKGTATHSSNEAGGVASEGPILGANFAADATPRSSDKATTSVGALELLAWPPCSRLTIWPWPWRRRVNYSWEVVGHVTGRVALPSAPEDQCSNMDLPQAIVALRQLSATSLSESGLAGKRAKSSSVCDSPSP